MICKLHPLNLGGYREKIFPSHSSGQCLTTKDHQAPNINGANTEKTCFIQTARNLSTKNQLGVWELSSLLEAKLILVSGRVSWTYQRSSMFPTVLNKGTPQGQTDGFYSLAGQPGTD